MGDRYGRKPVLVITLLMIGVGTTAIGLLPTYAQDRLLGAAPAGGAARRAGSGRRRRVWRRGDLPGGECAAEASRLLGRLRATRRFGRQPDGCRRLRPRDHVAARRSDVVGMARAIPRQHPADRRRHLCPPARHRNTGLHRSGCGQEQGREQSGNGGPAEASAQLHGRAGRAAGRKRPGLPLPGMGAELRHQPGRFPEPMP